MWASQGHSPIALVGQTKADVRDTMIELFESSIIRISKPSFMPEYEPSKRRLTWPNGVVAIAYSGDEPDQLRGPQHAKALVDELAKYKYPQDTWDNLMFGLRIGSNPQVAVTTTPRPIKIIKQLVVDSMKEGTDIALTKGHTLDNRDNLAPQFLKKIMDRYQGTRVGRQELAGEILDDNPNALWRRDWIERGRVKDHPDLVRIVVAIDPEATSTEDSAETGIIVAGRDAYGQGYILEDASIKGTPDVWGGASVTAFNVHAADLVVGEVNNGGEMVGYVIQTVSDTRIPYKAVHASRGKVIRAEPISALYVQGNIHHVGTFPELEDQLCEWVPGDTSPDRLDALVWALTELFYPDGVEEIITYDLVDEVMDRLLI